MLNRSAHRVRRGGYTLRGRAVSGLALAALVLAATATPSAAQRSSGEYRLVTPEGHTLEINDAQFSFDGRLVITAGADGSARLWEAATGREIRALQGHTRGINSARFSPDGGAVVTASDDSTVRIWDVATGEVRSTLRLHRGPVLAATFSGDGRFLATAGWDSTALVVDLVSGKPVWEFRSDSGVVDDVSFSPDGRFLATAGWDGAARLWDLTYGRPVQVLPGHRAGVRRVGFSPDGRLLVTAGGDDGVVRVWDIAAGGVINQDSTAGQISTAGFCGGRDRIIVAGGGPSASVGRLLAADSMRVVASFHAKGHRVGAANCSADGRLVVTAGGEGRIRIWDAETGAPQVELRGYDLKLSRSAALSPDGRYAAALGTDTAAYVWELSSGRPVARLSGHRGVLTTIAFSPDGTRLATAGFDRTARVWDARGHELLVLAGHRQIVWSAAFSPSGTSVVTASLDSTVRIWNAVSGELLLTIQPGFVLSALFSADGRAVITVGRKVRIWDSSSGRLLRELPIEVPREAVLSPDRRLLVATAWDASARLVDAGTGRVLRELSGLSAPVSQAVFTPDGRQLLTTAADGVTIWDVSTGRVVRRLAGTAERRPPRIIGVLRDGQRLLTVSIDGAIRLWDLGTGSTLLTRYVMDEREWVAVAPDGRFEGTEEAMQRLHYARGVETVPLEAFFDRYYTPGLTELIMRGRPAAGPDIRRGVGSRPTVRILSPTTGDSVGRSVTVVVEAKDQGGGVEDVRLYHDGALVGGTTRSLGLRRDRCPTGASCFTVELLAGTNVLEATAYSRDRIEAERARVVVRSPGTVSPSTLYVLAIGINKYRNPRYNLNYGRADAGAFLDSVVTGGAGIFRQVVVDTLFDEHATGDSIRAALASLADRARPEDVFVLYYAGHGTVEQVGDSTRFYLVPTDVTQLSDSTQLGRLGVSSTELYDLLARVPARKKLMVVDACQSGEMLAAFARRGAAEERAIAQLARASGTYVMSSTDSDQYASEVATLGHGVFTYGLLQALGGERKAGSGGSPRERMVGEIVSAAARLIPDLSTRYRTQAQYPMVFSNGQDFPLVVK